MSITSIRNHAMSYWLLKSEPYSYSIEMLQKEKNKTTHWDGVRNYQARNFMRDNMQKGDLAFFYHSNCKTPGIVGIVQVIKESYADFTAFDPKDEHHDPKSDPNHPRWVMIDVQYREQFQETIALHELRNALQLRNMLILRKGNRLSITPITQEEWDTILALRHTSH